MYPHRREPHGVLKPYAKLVHFLLRREIFMRIVPERGKSMVW